MLCTRLTPFSHITARPAFARVLSGNRAHNFFLPLYLTSRSFSHASAGIDEHKLNKRMEDPPIPQNKLILCFDGTGNAFKANTQDTNIVKLYNKFDRDSPHQMHYYQPGIGTYTSDGKAVSSSLLGKLQSSVSKTIDEGLATSFESHVCSGYRFLMRYYKPGDQIYLFGFSRGAFTARFLARMVSKVGLLSMGNEELVPFAYQIYHQYELGKSASRINKSGVPSQQPAHEDVEFLNQAQYLDNFKVTFCRHEGDHKHNSDNGSKQQQCGVKPHFLGLFDTVSSVGTLDVPFTSTPKLPSVGGTAKHIRHAVAIDEHRVKFKVALLQQDLSDSKVEEDVKEVWFAGNHGDVGGGWSSMEGDAENEPPTKDYDKDNYQLSDIALKWMIEELDDLPGGPEDKPQWNERRDGFMDKFDKEKGGKYDEAIKAKIHNTMTSPDSPWYKVLLWWFMEYCPLIKRWEYYWDNKSDDGHWKYVAFPLNKGGGRDIPPNAKFHDSVVRRMKAGSYKPINDVFIKDSENKVRSKASDKLHNVVVSGADVPKSQEEGLRHLEFKRVGDSKRDRDLYYIERK